MQITHYRFQDPTNILHIYLRCRVSKTIMLFTNCIVLNCIVHQINSMNYNNHIHVCPQSHLSIKYSIYITIHSDLDHTVIN